MKLFIYKTLIVIFLAYILFEFTIGQKIKKFESKIKKKVLTLSTVNKSSVSKIKSKLINYVS